MTATEYSSTWKQDGDKEIRIDQLMTVDSACGTGAIRREDVSGTVDHHISAVVRRTESPTCSVGE